jgi:hypothetical protein
MTAFQHPRSRSLAYARASFPLHPVAGELLCVLGRLELLQWSVPRAASEPQARALAAS